MKNFRNKTIVITGAGSGIGRALSIEFSRLGAHLILNDYNSESLEETVGLVSSSDSKIYSECFDVSDAGKMKSFATNAIDKLGPPDVVINNAGVSLLGNTLVDTELKDFKWLFDINFWGVVNGTKEFLPSLLKKTEAALVNISSVFGLMGSLNSIPYCSSKFAVRGFTETLILELEETNVNVHCVHPGGIKTNIVKAANERFSDDSDGTDLEFEKKFLKISPQEAALTIIKGIKRKKTRILIGKEAYLIDFFSRLSPIRFMKMVNKNFMPK